MTNEKVIDQAHHDFEQNPYILHVTVASMYGTKYLDNTMKFLSDKFLRRNNSDNDIWLIGIDIPEGEGDIQKMLVTIFIHFYDSIVNIL